jgi:hypothetical protein
MNIFTNFIKIEANIFYTEEFFLSSGMDRRSFMFFYVGLLLRITAG